MTPTHPYSQPEEENMYKLIKGLEVEGTISL